MSIAWAIERHDFLETTQSVAKEKALQGSKEGLVIQADEQGAGTGRFGREWESPTGNLYLSFILKPNCNVSAAGQLSFVVSLALFDLILGMVSDDVDIILKWPNDVLLAGEKCAGILLETDIGADNSVNWVVVGLGLNVLKAPEIGSALQGYANVPLDIDSIRDELLANIERYYGMWRAEGFSSISDLWLEKTYGVGVEVSVNVAGKLETGAFHGIDDVGNLIIRDASGKNKTISAGEVHFNVGS